MTCLVLMKAMKGGAPDAEMVELQVEVLVEYRVGRLWRRLHGGVDWPHLSSSFARSSTVRMSWVSHGLFFRNPR